MSEIYARDYIRDHVSPVLVFSLQLYSKRYYDTVDVILKYSIFGMVCMAATLILL